MFITVSKQSIKWCSCGHSFCLSFYISLITHIFFFFIRDKLTMEIVHRLQRDQMKDSGQETLSPSNLIDEDDSSNQIDSDRILSASSRVVKTNGKIIFPEPVENIGKLRQPYSLVEMEECCVLQLLVILWCVALNEFWWRWHLCWKSKSSHYLTVISFFHCFLNLFYFFVSKCSSGADGPPIWSKCCKNSTKI